MREPANSAPRPNQARVVEVAEETFSREVLEARQPVLVEFGAPWSQPCQLLEAVLKDIATACTGKVKVLKVNVDDSLDLSLCYDIQSIPTLLVFLKGNPCGRIVGTASKDAILAQLKPFAAPS
jgi:thioredoxin 1